MSIPEWIRQPVNACGVPIPAFEAAGLEGCLQRLDWLANEAQREADLKQQRPERRAIQAANWRDATQVATENPIARMETLERRIAERARNLARPPHQTAVAQQYGEWWLVVLAVTLLGPLLAAALFPPLRRLMFQHGLLSLSAWVKRWRWLLPIGFGLRAGGEALMQQAQVWWGHRRQEEFEWARVGGAGFEGLIEMFMGTLGGPLAKWLFKGRFGFVGQLVSSAIFGAVSAAAAAWPASWAGEFATGVLEGSDKPLGQIAEDAVKAANQNFLASLILGGAMGGVGGAFSRMDVPADVSNNDPSADIPLEAKMELRLNEAGIRVENSSDVQGQFRKLVDQKFDEFTNFVGLDRLMLTVHDEAVTLHRSTKDTFEEEFLAQGLPELSDSNINEARYFIDSMIRNNRLRVIGSVLGNDHKIFTDIQALSKESQGAVAQAGWERIHSKNKFVTMLDDAPRLRDK